MKTFSARLKSNMGCRCRDCTVVGFLTTYVAFTTQARCTRYNIMW